MSNKTQAQDNTEQEAPVAYAYTLNMDQSAQQQQTVIGVVTGPAQIAYAAPAYQAAPMVATGATPVVGAIPSANQPASSFPASPALAGQHQLAYQQVQHFQQQQQQQQQQQLQVFWANQIQEVEQTTDFKNHSLPLARIKKIMKADEDVRMISAEAPVIFAKACEMFILELTLRSWIHTEENKRRTLQKNDIAAAITRTDIFDFLVDIVPRDELKEEGLGIPRAAIPAVGAPAESIPYYYVPPHGSPGMIVGKPVDQTAAAIYATQQSRPVAYMAWQQPQAQAQQTQGQGQQPQQQQQQPGSTGTAES
ncbi:nuclear transcription factor Y subunit C-2-like isoform X1 [Aristolochia californica]|uniref:nuclear transcription factor Y subunit C-2-like isoform X1 n=2 Tax=Aristolochia californica TaxID=171875 RepID=UPI0035E22F01